jgi:DNA-binding NarL/FixJ family response regulator
MRTKPVNLFVTVGKLMYREALLLRLLSQPGLNLVGESASGAETLNCLSWCRPDLLLIEEDLPDNDGLTVAETALLRVPSLIVVLLVESAVNENRLRIYLESGIASVVAKTRPVQQLLKSILYVQAGRVYVDPGSCQPHSTLRRTRPSGPPSLIDRSAWHTLSGREREVAELLARQQPVKEIAARLGVSGKTVHTYKERILIKTGCSGALELKLYLKRVRYGIDTAEGSDDEAV